MRWVALAGLAGVAALAFWLWGLDGAQDVTRWAADGQREVQGQMAGYLRGLKQGDTAALFSLLLLCFAYGFFHAAGPGHGKLVIGGYGLASRISMFRLSALAVASSLGQSLTAIALVGFGTAIFGWSRAQMTGMADDYLQSVSYGAVAMVGLWLAVRGGRSLWAQVRNSRHAHGHHGSDDHAHGEHHHDHHHPHHHHHGADCGCGHSHGPTLEEAEAVRSWRDAFAIIGSVAIRPCTGALFLLIITWSMGIFYAGVLGALVMGIGTASVTVLVAIASTRARVAALGEMQALPWASGLLQVGGGALIALIAGQIALASL